MSIFEKLNEASPDELKGVLQKIIDSNPEDFSRFLKNVAQVYEMEVNHRFRLIEDRLIVLEAFEKRVTDKLSEIIRVAESLDSRVASLLYTRWKNSER